MRNRITGSFGSTSYAEIRRRVFDEPHGKYRLDLNPDDLATVVMALREYSQTCANAPGECDNERAQSLYLGILETLDVEEI